MKRITSTLIILMSLTLVTFGYQNCGQQEFSSISSKVVSVDTDFDGIEDQDEVASCTVETNEDTDGDGLLDGEELNVHFTDPCKADTDNGGTNDGDEINQGTNPRDNPNDDVIDDNQDVDTDGDGLFDSVEDQIGTDKNNPDTDGDGLSDGREYNQNISDPLKFDTDGGGIHDGLEVLRLSTNPKDASDDDPIKGVCNIVFNESLAKEELVCIGGLLNKPIITFELFAAKSSDEVSPKFKVLKIEEAQEPTSVCTVDDGEFEACDPNATSEFKDLELADHILNLLVTDSAAGRKDIFEYEFTVKEEEPVATPDPIDGVWSPWMPTPGTCTAACKRTDNFTRTCTPPQNGGLACEGPSTKQEVVDCNFGEGLCEAPKTPGALVASPAQFSFPNVEINKTNTQRVSLTNSGQEQVKFASALVINGAADYQLFHTCGNTLAGGASCDLTVVFAPTVKGVKVASLTALYTSGLDTTVKNLNLGIQGEAKHVYSGNWIVASVDCSNNPGSPAVTLTSGEAQCSNNDCDPATKPAPETVSCPAIPYSGNWVTPAAAACTTTPGTGPHATIGAAVYCPSGKVCDPGAKPSVDTKSCPAVAYDAWTVPSAPACTSVFGASAYTSYGATPYCASGRVCDPNKKPAKARKSCPAGKSNQVKWCYWSKMDKNSGFWCLRNNNNVCHLAAASSTQNILERHATGSWATVKSGPGTVLMQCKSEIRTMSVQQYNAHKNAIW